MSFRRSGLLLACVVALALSAPAQILRLPEYILVQAPSKEKPQAQEEKPDHHISPEEAKELLASVDTILEFDHQDTDLPLKHTVKRQLVSRDQVQAFVEKRIKGDEDAQRLQRAEVVLKKFALLPRQFDLQKFLVDLLREQVAGYYDPDTKTVYLLDWLEPEQQKPVMAHELTHALQDQNFGLKKWMKDSQKHSAEAEVTSDEQTAARTAVVEGQAMAVMIDYLLEPAGQSVLKSPRIVDAIEAGMASGAGMPLFDSAPLYLKNLLIFPYTYGLNFTRTMLEKGGKKQAFEQVFKNAPQNTRQIMQPDTYLSPQAIPELQVPELVKMLGSGYERYDVGSIGQFDSDVIIRTYSKKDENEKLAQGWRGGWYYAVKRKGQDVTADTLGLVYVSRWADEATAKQFAQVYSAYVPMRYAGANSTDAGATWNTTAGPVIVSQQQNTVVVVEGFDAANTQKMREAVAKSLSGN